MSRYIKLAVFLIAVVGGGIAIGIFNPPGEWYAALKKPSFNPPNWIFAPVWTVLYVFIAVAGWRTWMRQPAGAAMKVWFAQLALNFGWPPLFFGAHRMIFALTVLIALAVSIGIFIALTHRMDKIAAWLFAPYLAWVSFATLLNASVIALN